MYGRLGIGLFVVLMTACSDPAEEPASGGASPDNTLMRVITGEVWYRERIALRPGTEIRVTLEDQSRADAPATVITDYTLTVDGPGPYTYRLVYDPSAIDERMRYGLRARVEYEGRLQFTSTEHIDPFVRTPGEAVNIMVAGTP